MRHVDAGGQAALALVDEAAEVLVRVVGVEALEVDAGRQRFEHAGLDVLHQLAGGILQLVEREAAVDHVLVDGVEAHLGRADAGGHHGVLLVLVEHVGALEHGRRPGVAACLLGPALHEAVHQVADLDPVADGLGRQAASAVAGVRAGEPQRLRAAQAVDLDAHAHGMSASHRGRKVHGAVDAIDVEQLQREAVVQLLVADAPRQVLAIAGGALDDVAADLAEAQPAGDLAVAALAPLGKGLFNCGVGGLVLRGAVDQLGTHLQPRRLGADDVVGDQGEVTLTHVGVHRPVTAAGAQRAERGFQVGVDAGVEGQPAGGQAIGSGGAEGALTADDREGGLRQLGHHGVDCLGSGLAAAAPDAAELGLIRCLLTAGHVGTALGCMGGSEVQQHAARPVVRGLIQIVVQRAAGGLHGRHGGDSCAKYSGLKASQALNWPTYRSRHRIVRGALL